MTPFRSARPFGLATLGLFLLAGCGAAHHLHEYDFGGRSTAVIAAIPPRPEVFTGFWEDAWVDPYNPVGSILQAGAAVAKQVEVRKAQARLDSALQDVDVAERIARQALVRSAEHLRYRISNDPDAADFVLDIRVHDYGIVASSWRGDAFFELNAEVVLLDNRAKKEIWSDRIVERERITPAVFGFGPALGNVLTAEALSRLSAEEMALGLERLADYAADRMTMRLRKDYDRSREKHVGA